jgi:hypothetical protein
MRGMELKTRWKVGGYNSTCGRGKTMRWRRRMK